MSAARRVNGIGPVAARVVRHLLARRRQLGLTTAQVAERTAELGRPLLPNAITKIELGQRNIDVDDLVVLSAVLDLTPAGLLMPERECAACHGQPPAGFACLSCGAEAAR